MWVNPYVNRSWGAIRTRAGYSDLRGVGWSSDQVEVTQIGHYAARRSHAVALDMCMFGRGSVVVRCLVNPVTRDSSHAVQRGIGRSSHHGWPGNPSDRRRQNRHSRAGSHADTCRILRTRALHRAEPPRAGTATWWRRSCVRHSRRIRCGSATPACLGYQEVRRPGRAPYAQVRMTGIIEEFAPRAPGPDGGRVYRRLMTSLEAAPGVLGWGEPAVLQAKAAARVARSRWSLPVDRPSAPGYVD
jgi:hypothetical protein